jgi:hypothetical protein
LRQGARERRRTQLRFENISRPSSTSDRVSLVEMPGAFAAPYQLDNPGTLILDF